MLFQRIILNFQRISYAKCYGYNDCYSNFR